MLTLTGDSGDVRATLLDLLEPMLYLLSEYTHEVAVVPPLSVSI